MDRVARQQSAIVQIEIEIEDRMLGGAAGSGTDFPPSPDRRTPSRLTRRLSSSTVVTRVVVLDLDHQRKPQTERRHRIDAGNRDV